MVKFLIKSSNEVRLESKLDVQTFQENLQQEANDGGYVLSNFAWVEKEVKEKGEVVDTYYQVKYTFTFNDLRDPETPYNSIDYNVRGVNNEY